MILVLNELSYSFNWPEDQAKPLYDTLFGVCLSLEKDFKDKVILRYSKNTDSEDVVFRHDPNFLKWLSSQKKEEKLSILSTITGGQFILDDPYYSISGEYGIGFGYAYENEELLLSFQSDKKWEATSLDITEEYIDDETNKVESNEIKIRNCHNEDSRKVHTDFLQSRFKDSNDATLKKIKKEIVRGELLWDNRTALFPNLVFCESTKDYIINIQSGDVLQNLLRRLYEYEIYFKNWDNGDFAYKNVGGNVRLESDTRIRKFTELSVACPDGINRPFTYHCNYGVGGFRMHFFPNVDSRKCIIGYIGKKIV